MEKNEPLIFMDKSKNFALWNWNKMDGIPFTFFEVKISNKELILILLNFELQVGNRYSQTTSNSSQQDKKVRSISPEQDTRKVTK